MIIVTPMAIPIGLVIEIRGYPGQLRTPGRDMPAYDKLAYTIGVASAYERPKRAD
jgi:hypothetical protein